MRRLFALLLLVLPVAAFAAIPPALLNLEKQGYSIGQSFIGPDGLTGWVVENSGHTIIVYTTPSGNYAFSGTLVDKDGMDLTSQYLQRYMPDADLVKIVADLQKDPTVVDEGSPTAPPLYAFADANCIYCNHLWTELRPLVATGKVRVHWVMLAFLKQTSIGRAAAILGTGDKVAALTKDEIDFDKDHEEGGIPPLDAVSDPIRAALVAHTDAMRSAGGQGTPLLIYRGGNKWHSIEGLPKDLTAFVGALEHAP